jgi:hypothetical protein
MNDPRNGPCLAPAPGERGSFRVPRWFELPPAAQDWVRLEQAALWLPSALADQDFANAHRVLREWDALTGRLLRESLFGDGGRELRLTAEAVAAVAESLAVTIGAVNR